MPIVAYFTQTITDSAAFLKATTVKVNGATPAAPGTSRPTATPRKPLAAHYRPQNYWPANSTITMNMPVQGLRGGGAFVFDDSLTLSMSIGDAHVSTVDCTAERMTVSRTACRRTRRS